MEAVISSETLVTKYETTRSDTVINTFTDVRS
jgi:hypothetical protein